MIARVRIYDYNDVVEHLARLQKAVDGVTSHNILVEMKHMVPEFKSNNSQWQDIDAEIVNDTDADMHEIDITAAIPK